MRATQMRQPPDLFELRLDALHHDLQQVKTAIGQLQAPIIITARHSAEGGHNALSAKERLELLLRFLPEAGYVDVELRSAAELNLILREAERRRIGRIISFHDFSQTPSVGKLAKLAHAASTLGADIFKVATRTNTHDDLDRLIEFFTLSGQHMAIGAMGMGKFGRRARRQLMQLGSVLNYAPLGSSQVDGQLSLREMRQKLHRFDFGLDSRQP